MIGVSLLLGGLMMGLVWTRETPLWTLPSRKEKVCVCIRQQCLTPVSCHYRVSHIIESLTFFLYSADTC